ncbi:MAG: hypothetical protein AB1507_04990 [Bacillota bacterium]
MEAQAVSPIAVVFFILLSVFVIVKIVKGVQTGGSAEMKVPGIVISSIGGLGVLLSIFLIVQDISGGFLIRYSYQPPFTDHELGRLFLLGLTVVLTVVGTVLWVKGSAAEKY